MHWIYASPSCNSYIGLCSLILVSSGRVQTRLYVVKFYGYFSPVLYIYISQNEQLPRAFAKNPTAVSIHEHEQSLGGGGLCKYIITQDFIFSVNGYAVCITSMYEKHTVQKKGGCGSPEMQLYCWIYLQMLDSLFNAGMKW